MVSAEQAAAIRRADKEARALGFRECIARSIAHTYVKAAPNENLYLRFYIQFGTWSAYSSNGETMIRGSTAAEVFILQELNGWK